MGFRNGDRLGKDGSGRTEPIAIGINNGRKGIGLKDKRDENSLEISNTSTRSPRSFLDAKKQAYEFSTVQRELDAVRRTCRLLDAESGVKHSDLWKIQDEPREKAEDVAVMQESEC